MRPGFVTGDAVSGSLVTPSASFRGMHGYWPDQPEMNASFFLLGPGIPAAHSLGLIDMRAIAPTLAQILGLRLPSAEVPPVLP